MPVTFVVCTLAYFFYAVFIPSFSPPILPFLIPFSISTLSYSLSTLTFFSNFVQEKYRMAFKCIHMKVANTWLESFNIRK